MMSAEPNNVWESPSRPGTEQGCQPGYVLAEMCATLGPHRLFCKQLIKPR